MIDKYEEGTVDVYNDITEERVTVRCTYLTGANEITNYSPPSLIKGWRVLTETYKKMPEPEKRWNYGPVEIRPS